MSKESKQLEEQSSQSPREADQGGAGDIAENEMSRELDAVSALTSLAMPSLDRSLSPTLDESDGDDSDNEEMDAEEQSGILDKGESKGKISNKKASFPYKLMEVLTMDEYSDIITWMPHGKSFLIKNRKRFTEIVLAAHFKKSLFPSFTRKLNRWGFIRIGKGVETGAYYNKHFLRDNPSVLAKMRCQKRHERKKRAWSPSDTERNSHESRYRSLSETSDENLIPGSMTQSEQMHRFHLLYLTRLKHRQEHRLLMAATLQKQLDLYEQNNQESFNAFSSQIGKKKDADDFNTKSPMLRRRLSDNSTNIGPIASQRASKSDMQYLDLAEQFCSMSTSPAVASINQSRNILPTTLNSSGLASIARFSPNTNTLRMKPPRQQWEMEYQKEIELQKTLDGVPPSTYPLSHTIRMKPPRHQWEMEYQREIELQKELEMQKVNSERPLPKKSNDSLQSKGANAA